MSAPGDATGPSRSTTSAETGTTPLGVTQGINGYLVMCNTSTQSEIRVTSFVRIRVLTMEGSINPSVWLTDELGKAEHVAKEMILLSLCEPWRLL